MPAVEPADRRTLSPSPFPSEIDDRPMNLRLTKTLLVASLALMATLVALNNITDYGSNFMFVQHVMSMDTTFEGNALMWRAITLPAAHHAAYVLIIAVETSVAVLCWLGTVAMWRARAGTTARFWAAKRWATLGILAGILLWFVGFSVVGAEWFLMWQSQTWNGQEAAFRLVVVLYATLIFLHLPGTDALDEPGQTP